MSEFCCRLTDSWGPILSPLVHSWLAGNTSKGELRNFARTLVPCSLYDALVPDKCAKRMLISILPDRRKRVTSTIKDACSIAGNTQPPIPSPLPLVLTLSLIPRGPRVHQTGLPQDVFICTALPLLCLNSSLPATARASAAHPNSVPHTPRNAKLPLPLRSAANLLCPNFCLLCDLPSAGYDQHRTISSSRPFRTTTSFLTPYLPQFCGTGAYFFFFHSIVKVYWTLIVRQARFLRSLDYQYNEQISHSGSVSFLCLSFVCCCFRLRDAPPPPIFCSPWQPPPRPGSHPFRQKSCSRVPCTPPPRHWALHQAALLPVQSPLLVVVHSTGSPADGPPHHNSWFLEWSPPSSVSVRRPGSPDRQCAFPSQIFPAAPRRGPVSAGTVLFLFTVSSSRPSSGPLTGLGESTFLSSPFFGQHECCTYFRSSLEYFSGGALCMRLA